MCANDAKKLKGLEKENNRLKTNVANLTLNVAVLNFRRPFRGYKRNQENLTSTAQEANRPIAVSEKLTVELGWEMEFAASND